MVIFTQRLAGYLMLHGFNLLRIEPNLKNPKFNVFVFEDCAELRLKIAEYTRTSSLIY